MGLIEQIEEKAGGVVAAYTLLGVSRNQWYAYRRAGEVPKYIAASINAHMALAKATFVRMAAAQAAREEG